MRLGLKTVGKKTPQSGMGGAIQEPFGRSTISGVDSTPGSHNRVLQTSTSQTRSRWYNKVQDDSFDEDYSNFFTLTGPVGEGWESSLIRPPFQWNGLLGIHPRTELPESLLRGPWPSDVIKHLFWFVRAGARIDYHESTKGEVCNREAFRPRVHQHNSRSLFGI
jgi:hypothetical protein